MFLKKIKLINYCGYRKQEFNFVKPSGQPYRYVCFFGPNGYGKTSMLEAIQLLTFNTIGYNVDRIYNKLKPSVYNKTNIGAYHNVAGMEYKDNFIVKQKKNKQPEMLIEGTFSDGQKDYVVSLNEYGFTRNDLAPFSDSDTTKEERIKTLFSGPFGKNHFPYRQRLIHFLKSDTDLSMTRFQLKTNYIPIFENIISDITGYEIKCIEPSGTVPEDFEYCTNFEMIKFGDEHIHFKAMSAGEKKIAKSFSEVFNIMDDLANPKRKDLNEIQMIGYPKIILIDNVEMHAYYKRHISLVDKLKESFKDQQIFATTHSGVLIPRFLEGLNDTENELYVDLEPLNNRQKG